MHPLPSLSYILNVHLSLCSNLPLRTKFKAATYSRKSMVLSCVQEEKELNFYVMKGHLDGTYEQNVSLLWQAKCLFY